MKRCRFSLLALIAVALPSLAFADTPGFAFLNVPAGARAAGLGGAYATVAEGVEGAYWNPAGLGFAKGIQLFAGHQEYIQGLRHEQVAVAGRTLGGGYALSLRAMYTPPIDKRDDLGNLVGTFGEQDLDFGLTYGREWVHGVNAGMSLRWLRERLDNEAVNSFPIDLGVTWDAPALSGLRLGLAAQALGGSPRYTIDGTQGEPIPLPTSIQGGASYRFHVSNAWSALGSAETRFVRGRSGVLLTGLEVTSSVGGDLRVGWRGNDDATDFSAGAGWRFHAVRIDYAFVPYQSDLGDTHRLSLLAQF